MLNTTCSRHFWTLKRRFAWQAKRILHPAKNLIQSEQNVRGFVSVFKNVGRRGIFEEDLQKCLFCIAGAIQETHESDTLGGQGADFLRGVAFWSLKSSGLLR